MAALPTEPGDEFQALNEQAVAVHGALRFTREAAVDAKLSDAFHALYQMAFAPLAARSVARQVLTADEFHAQMTDARIDKYVAWNDRGQPVGITTLTRHLDTIPWISPDYFRVNYPDHWRRNAVYYLGFTLAHPSLRHQRMLETVMQIGIDPLIKQRAVVAYDVCAYNNTELRFHDRIADALSRYPNVELEAIDAQSYYSVRFA